MGSASRPDPARHAHVFDTSVRENVLLARRSAGPCEVRAALAGARLLEWVDRLPDGSATAVGEHGSRVSGGQRQRVAMWDLERDARQLKTPSAVGGR